MLEMSAAMVLFHDYRNKLIGGTLFARLSATFLILIVATPSSLAAPM